MSARPVIRQLAQLDDFATLSDAAAGTASLRTLGTAATQAAAGNHGHAASAITSGVLAMARLATGTPDGTKFVRDDGTLVTPPAADLSTAPILAPATAARNTLQPSADVPALTLKARAAGQTAALQEWQDDAAAVGARIVLADPLIVGSASGARLDFPANGSGHGPTNISSWSVTFESIVDPCIGLTYNYGASAGVPVLAGEGGCAVVLEGDYTIGGIRTMESYFEGRNNAGTKTARPFFCDYLKTATTKETLLRSTVLSGGSNGIILRWARDAGDLDMITITPNTIRVDAPDTGANTVLSLRAATGRYSQVVLGANAVDNLFFLYCDTATHANLNFSGREGLHIHKPASGTAVSIGVNWDLASLLVKNDRAVGDPVLIAQGKAGQTGDLIRAWTSAETPTWAINNLGHEVFADGFNQIFGTTTGAKIGTATNQKLAFHNSTPVIQRAGAAQAAVATTGSALAVFGYTTAAQADGIVTLLNEIRATLVEKGLMKGAA